VYVNWIGELAICPLDDKVHFGNACQDFLGQIVEREDQIVGLPSSSAELVIVEI